MDRAIYKCDECSMELTIFGSSDKGCVRCGGNLSKIRELDQPRYNHPMQAMADALDKAREHQSRETAIDAIVAHEFPRMLDEIEKFVYHEYMMDQAGGSEYGEEDGVGN